MPQDLISQFDRKYALPIETYRQVQNITQRNAIPAPIRWEGMMCYVLSEGLSYVLTAGMENSDWVEFGALVDVTVVDNLLSTSPTDALSANQGRVLEQSKLSDAPSDGDTYGRKDGAWTLIAAGGTEWGEITGTLSDQTDLQAALDGLMDLSTEQTATAHKTFSDGISASFAELGPFANALFLDGDGVGTANRVNINFRDSGGALQGALGFNSATDDDFEWSNDESSTGLSLLGSGGANGLQYDYSGGPGTVYHSGNLTLGTLGGVPTSRNLTAGTGLTGGGTLADNRSFSLDLTYTDGRYVQDWGDLLGQYKSLIGNDENPSSAGPYRYSSVGSGYTWHGVFNSNEAVDLNVSPTVLRFRGSIDGTTMLSTWNDVWHSGNITPVPTSRTLTAGNGLTGGGDLSANRTFTLGTPGSTTLASTNAVTASSHTHAFAPGGTTAQYIRGDGSLATYAAGGVTSVFGRTGAVVAANGDYTFAQIGSKPTTLSGYGITDGVPTSRTLTAGTGLTGGGDLSANRSFSLDTEYTDGRYLRADANSTKTSGYTRYNDNNELQFGTDNDSHIFHSGTHSYWDLNNGNLIIRESSSTRFTFERTTGNLTATGNITATNFILSSDRRLKKNIGDYSPKPLNLKYRTWEWKKDGRPGKGFIAQEVQKTNPEYVVEGADGMLAVDYIGILIAKVAELESRILKLEI